MAREPGSYITDPETGEERLVHRTQCDLPAVDTPGQPTDNQDDEE